MNDEHLTVLGIALKRGLIKAGRLIEAEDYLFVQALSLGIFSFIMGLQFF